MVVRACGAVAWSVLRVVVPSWAARRFFVMRYRGRQYIRFKTGARLAGPLGFCASACLGRRAVGKCGRLAGYSAFGCVCGVPLPVSLAAYGGALFGGGGF